MARFHILDNPAHPGTQPVPGMPLFFDATAAPVMAPIVCPLRFVQGYRCTHCGWARVFPECHVEWAVPFCYRTKYQSEYDEHDCHATENRPAGNDTLAANQQTERRDAPACCISE